MKITKILGLYLLGTVLLMCAFPIGVKLNYPLSDFASGMAGIGLALTAIGYITVAEAIFLISTLIFIFKKCSSKILIYIFGFLFLFQFLVGLMYADLPEILLYPSFIFSM